MAKISVDSRHRFKLMSRFPLFIAIVGSLAATGCSQRGEYAVRNETTNELTDVRVVIGTKHRFLHGILIPNSHSGFSGPIAGSGNLPVEIAWRVDAKTVLTNRTSIPATALRKEMNVQFLITSTGAVTRIKGI
jgi:hypothetical protein